MGGTPGRRGEWGGGSEVQAAATVHTSRHVKQNGARANGQVLESVIDRRSAAKSRGEVSQGPAGRAGLGG